jgi:preprotein translocase subunit SecA
MNEQRRVIYKYRREILEGRDMSEAAQQELAGVVSRLVEEYTPGDIVEDWDMGGLAGQVRQIWPSTVELASMSPESVDREALREELSTDALQAYQRRESEFGTDLMRYLERAILLQVIDNRWREHLFEMDYLREGIHLRGFAQIDPLVAYKNEGFSMFDQLMNGIWEEFSRLIFHVQVDIAPAAAEEAFAPAASRQDVNYSGGTPDQQPSALDAAAAQGGVATAAPEAAPTGDGDGAPPAPRRAEVETRVKDEHEKIGRNDPCWCGSGKKYKKCHGA